MNLPTMREAQIWRGSHRGLGIKVSHSKGMINDGYGAWAYYIIVPERNCPNFEALWLPSKVSRWTPASPERVSHDYYSLDLDGVEFHGGITYYDKHGDTKGHRSVELGCDYSHLWDHERGFENITYEEVLSDAVRTADQLAGKFSISEEVRP